jgi:endonuclease/exonuclease/phosphatase family metal-dependent hydrolase
MEKRMTTIVSWNIAHSDTPWRELEKMQADIALLQEAAIPPKDVAARIEYARNIKWKTAGKNRKWQTIVVKLSDKVKIEHIQTESLEHSDGKAIPVSRSGTVAAAEITIRTGEAFTVVSMYGAWESPLRSTGSSWIYADASVHRLLSDLSVLIGKQNNHKIIAAGDLNILYGYGEEGSKYWAERYKSVFTRAEAMGLIMVGPQAPYGGKQVVPWPKELPRNSKNVQTYRTRKDRPETATRQLDFVFVSKTIVPRAKVRAINNEKEWGTSDHCKIFIELRD